MALQNDENDRIGCILLVLILLESWYFPSPGPGGETNRGPGLYTRPQPQWWNRSQLPWVYEKSNLFFVCPIEVSSERFQVFIL